MDERRIYTGVFAEYSWLTSTEDYSGTLLRLCPEIVVGQYVAVTSVDSGVLRLTEDQLTEGWQSKGGVGYSPRIRSSEAIPHRYDGPDVVGYDEFYVFKLPCDLSESMEGNIFEEQSAPAPGRVELFWRQLLRIQPESYIADGLECLPLSAAEKS